VVGNPHAAVVPSLTGGFGLAETDWGSGGAPLLGMVYSRLSLRIRQAWALNLGYRVVQAVDYGRRNLLELGGGWLFAEDTHEENPTDDYP
jgi:hypothetical protein